LVYYATYRGGWFWPGPASHRALRLYGLISAKNRYSSSNMRAQFNVPS
jgi:hypothetical protein